MFLRPSIFRGLLPANKIPVMITRIQGFQDFPAPPQLPDVEMPEKRKLKVMDRIPQYPPNMRAFKMQKRLRYMRGPERLHVDFMHQQFGIIATGGGRLRQGHFEMIRNTIGRNLDTNRMFAIWRIDSPWQPVTRKGQGQRMGGGKGAIDHYVTPIKAGRVIVEIAGKCEYFEVKKCLEEVASKLPFKAIALDHKTLVDMRAEEKRLEEENINPWTFKYIIQNNIGGCQKWISPKDRHWFGKYR